MTKYWYIALDEFGTEQSGDTEAASEQHALQRLSERGLTVLEFSTEEISSGKSWLTREISFGSGKLSLSELIDVSRTLATLLEAKIAVPEALRLAQDLSERKRLREGLGALRRRILDGVSLADALDERANSYPAVFRSFVRVGEASNTLPESLLACAKVYERQRQTGSKLLSVLIYPVILVVFALVVLSILTFYLAPTLIAAVENAGGTPTGVLSSLGAANEFFREYWSLLGIAAVFISITSVVFLLSGKTQFWRMFINLVPVFRRITDDIGYSRFARTLSMLMTSGATLTEAFEITHSIYKNEPYSQTLKEAAQLIGQGQSACLAFEADRHVPKVFVALYQLGEKTNRIPAMLALVAEQLSERVEIRLERLIQLATPVLTLVIGIGIGVLVYAMLGAILEVNTLAY